MIKFKFSQQKRVSLQEKTKAKQEEKERLKRIDEDYYNWLRTLTPQEFRRISSGWGSSFYEDF